MPFRRRVSEPLIAASVLRNGRYVSGRLAQRFVERRAEGRGRRDTQRGTLSDLGQTTAEYGLVILAAGSLALAAILWARNSGSITNLFQSVIDQLTGSL